MNAWDQSKEWSVGCNVVYLIRFSQWVLLDQQVRQIKQLVHIVVPIVKVVFSW